MFRGKTLRVSLQDDGVAELCFDRTGEAVNKFDALTIAELREAIGAIAAERRVKGVLATSAKDVFIVGADITEFITMFQQPVDDLAAGIRRSNEVFVALEDLEVPSVVAINGFALGGGFEFALACAVRVISDAAQVGLPEVSLGLFPGFGGTVRLSRTAGTATAIDWVVRGKPADARTALAKGAVDAVAPAAELRQLALDTLARCISGDIDWRSLQQRKRGPVRESAAECAATFSEALRSLQAKTSPHQPAAAAAVVMMQRAASLPREAALDAESVAFSQVAKTQAAASLVRKFLNDQLVKKLAKKAAQGAKPVASAGVLGAGIMGGGIAVATARAGIDVSVKDISPAALDKAIAEAGRVVARWTKAGRVSAEQGDVIVRRIRPQADDAGLDSADLVIEAIVERLEVKQQVLAALEPRLASGAILASNTSSLRIRDIAAPLQRPQSLVGLHFFNPVPAMQLVEVVRGPQTSDEAVATAVAYANRIGKTPIVVADCPGFLVNRVLMAYLGAALRLIVEGADYQRIDAVMEAFGWPMGPSYLQDVIGIDTGSHVLDVISAGYPGRMPAIEGDPLKCMLEKGRLGQKSGAGFYTYERGADGKLGKTPSAEAQALVASLQTKGRRDFSDAEIVDRLMLAFVVEAAHALEEGVVGTAAELDTALQLGIGCPAHVGGPLQYADWLGLDEVVRRCDALRGAGPMYEATPGMREMAASGRSFHGGAR